MQKAKRLGPKNAKKDHKVPMGPHKVKGADGAVRTEQTTELPKPVNPKNTNMRKPVALKQKAGTGGYENPQSAFRRGDARV